MLGHGRSPQLSVELVPPKVLESQYLALVWLTSHPVFLDIEALASIQTAASDFLQAAGCRSHDIKDAVRSDFACEIDPHCQRVLAQTYKVCTFKDILELGATSKEFCATHGKKCRVMKKHLKSKNGNRTLSTYRLYHPIDCCFDWIHSIVCVLRSCQAGLQATQDE